jgi:hypothetical protein
VDLGDGNGDEEDIGVVIVAVDIPLVRVGIDGLPVCLAVSTIEPVSRLVFTFGPMFVSTFISILCRCSFP